VGSIDTIVAARARGASRQRRKTIAALRIRRSIRLSCDQTQQDDQAPVKPSMSPESLYRAIVEESLKGPRGNAPLGS
jgi:hypothetical protein